MEGIIDFFKFFKAMIEYRFGTGFSPNIVRIICDEMGYLIVDIKKVSDKESVIDIKTDYGYIRLKILDWHKFTAKFIPGYCRYPQKHDVFEMSYSFEDGSIPWEATKLPVVVDIALGD